jgi:hypothetical protein
LSPPAAANFFVSFCLLGQISYKPLLCPFCKDSICFSLQFSCFSASACASMMAFCFAICAGITMLAFCVERSLSARASSFFAAT